MVLGYMADHRPHNPLVLASELNERGQACIKAQQIAELQA